MKGVKTHIAAAADETLPDLMNLSLCRAFEAGLVGFCIDRCSSYCRVGSWTSVLGRSTFAMDNSGMLLPAGRYNPDEPASSDP
jgi:hypothetical protein